MAQSAHSVSKARSKNLTRRTREVYEKVIEHEDRETVLSALERIQGVLAQEGSAEALRQALDVESMHLRDVISSKQKLQETVGTLIAGYDSLTNALGGEIDSMKDRTLWESLVGLFSAKAARDIRERRIQGAEIDTQLQDLVAQTQSIGKLLEEHFQVLNGEYGTVQGMLEEQQRQLKTSTESFESADQELDRLNLEIAEQRDALAEQTGTARADADRALQARINHANEITERRNTALASAQTHEVFIENHKIALDSLMRQKAAQRILIDKLRISTENRIIQYAATLESLKTAAQQESAHAIHQIGTEVDEATTRTMAAIGTAADRSIIEMLEHHGDDVQRRRAQQSEVARADSEFARRFAEVAKQFLEEQVERKG
jgi:predicted DNA-binding protein